MLFNIEHDGGTHIIGYVVPDGYSGEAKLRIRANGRVLLEISTVDFRPALVTAGRHETGRCGFLLDNNLLPGLETIPDLEIVDVANNVLVYRRPQPTRLRKKILRLETHLFPLRKLDLSVAPFFQYSACRVEQYGKETVDQMFLLNGVDSVFLSGRIMYRGYQHYIDGQFSVFLVMQDPYEELAERILVLKALSQNEKKLLNERERMLFNPVIAYLANLSLADTAALKRCIINMPKEVIATLSNPIVRQLTVSTPDEMPQRFSVASALDMLSSCQLVGFRHEPNRLSEAIAETWNIDAAEISIPEQIPSIRKLGAMLKDMAAVRAFLEKDIELYQNASEAAKAVELGLGKFDDEG
ncbi:hypothetical protein [Methylocella sp. CPCC 101449]|uniref:hypothetical protein n=1 Tax=Methylocella sp. CPCC 101449 TaxID=2987531 RepID=UPI00288FEEFF|nr:hypothetical protein [Methylocella sp. CPCC 101449]MDT2019463.1 hypothetical protein [Methylocella sp. CPCC 101449]